MGPLFTAVLMSARRFSLAGAAAILAVHGQPHSVLAQSSASPRDNPSASTAVPAESKPPQTGLDDRVMIDAPLAAELFRTAEQGCMGPILVGRLRQQQDDTAGQLTNLLVGNCEPIVSAARDHLRAAGALAEGAPSAHDIALGMAEAVVREKLGPRALRNRAPASVEGGPILSPGGALTNPPPWR
jgi:hypothetical protein